MLDSSHVLAEPLVHPTAFCTDRRRAISSRRLALLCGLTLAAVAVGSHLVRKGYAQDEASGVALDSPLLFEPGFLQDFVATKTCGITDKRYLQTVQKGCQMPRMILDSNKEGMDIVMDAVQTGFRGLDIAAKRMDRYIAGVAAGLEQFFNNGLPRESLFLQLQFDPKEAARLNPNKTITMQYVEFLMKNTRALNANYIDSVVLSELYPSHPQTMEAWSAMEDTVQSGAVKQLGIRTAESLEQVRRVYREAKKVKPTVVQHMGSVSTKLEQEMFEWCRESGVYLQPNWTQTLISNRRALESKTMEDLAEKYSITPPALLLRYMIGLGAVPLVPMRGDFKAYNSAWRVPLAVKDAEKIDDLVKQHSQAI